MSCELWLLHWKWQIWSSSRVRSCNGGCLHMYVFLSVFLERIKPVDVFLFVVVIVWWHDAVTTWLGLNITYFENYSCSRSRNTGWSLPGPGCPVRAATCRWWRGWRRSGPDCCRGAGRLSWCGSFWMSKGNCLSYTDTNTIMSENKIPVSVIW